MSVLPGLCWLCFVGLVGANEFPNPQKEWRMCGRYKASFVCDPDFILDRGDVERLDHLADDFRRSTSCLCRPCRTGVSVGILVKKNVSQESMSKHKNAKGLAEMLRKGWNLGICNDDIVIVLLTQLNMSDFSMGSAVQNVFPQETAAKVLSDCRVHFESGWFYQGLESILNSFNDILIQLQKQKNGTSKGLIIGISLGAVVFLALTATAVFLLYQQARRRKKFSEDIFEEKPKKSNRKQFSHDREEKQQLQKLNASSSDDDEILSMEKYRSNTFQNLEENFHSYNFQRLKRQLSDVAEESEESETLKGSMDPASFNSSHCSPDSRTMQITEL